MRKLIISLICIILSAGAYAKDDINASGNTALLKESGTALLVMDFSDTTWEENEDFKEYSDDAYDERVEAATTNFYRSFNRNSKGLKLTQTEEGDYVMTFIVYDLERHQSAAGFWGQGRVYVTGTIEIKDAQSGDVVLTIDVEKFGSGEDYIVADGMGKSFKAIAEKITKLK